MREREGDVRVNENDSLQFCRDIRELGLVALEELTTSRDIEEQVLDEEVGTDGTSCGLLMGDM